jgi:hypothetical protein
MRLLTLACAAALLVGATRAQAQEPGTAPMAGTYVADVFIQSATGPDCLDTPGNYLAGVVNYSGLSATTIGIRVPDVRTDVAVISLQALKITNGAGTLTPSGTFTWKGAGIGANWDLTGTFSASLTEVDGFSFATKVTETYSGCTEVQLISLIRAAVKE